MTLSAPKAKRYFFYRMAAIAALLVVSALAGAPCWAQTPHYPELSGRVVDRAQVIDEATTATITEKLRDLELKSSIQLVVATVPSLEGLDIETYANTLFRKWGLGQAKDDNGLLFLFAINDRKMRLEVGRGLEGVMTDALSKVIEQSAIVPAFKKGDYSEGVARGVDAVIAALSVDKEDWKAKSRPTGNDYASLWPLLALALFLLIVMYLNRKTALRSRGFVVLPGPTMSDNTSRWGSGWGGGFDSFSGGGGDSGGGGASSDW